MRKASVAGITIVGVITIVGIVFILFMIQRTTGPVFRIIDHNYDLDIDWTEDFEPVYTMTVYVRIKNLGIEGCKTVVCEVTREDLTKIRKSQNVTIEGGRERTIKSVFSHSELHGVIPKEYGAWVD